MQFLSYANMPSYVLMLPFQYYIDDLWCYYSIFGTKHILHSIFKDMTILEMVESAPLQYRYVIRGDLTYLISMYVGMSDECKHISNKDAIELFGLLLAENAIEKTHSLISTSQFKEKLRQRSLSKLL